jgi:hypothetical protein
MTIEKSSGLLVRFYAVVAALSLLANLYVFLKPGISIPEYPDQKLLNSLRRIGSSSLVSTDQINVEKNTSDRSSSSIFTYSYDDGSKLLANLVRVRKRDDFKIETYGLLTKNIEQIYLKNSSSINITPPSHMGTVGKDKFIQTCVVPKGKQLSDSDYRLSNLTAIVERLNPANNTIYDKVLGTKKNIDYSCLVLTYRLPAEVKDKSFTHWQEVVRNVQKALGS